MDAVSGMFLAFALIYFAMADGIDAFRLTAKNFKKKTDLNETLCDV